MLKKYFNMDFEDLVGWTGCFLTTCFYIPQLGPFIQVLKKKLYFEDAPGFFISSCYANCFIWMIYGDMIFSDQLRITNIIACLICLIAIFIYLFYEIKKYTLDSILNFLILFMASWAVYKYLTIVLDDDRLVGKLCICTSIVIYLYFSYIIYRVIKEKNYLLIHLYQIIIYFVSCLVWLLYGIIAKDLYVVFPYAMGAVFSLLLIVIHLNFRKKYPGLEEKDLITSIGIESTGKEDNKKEENDIKIEEDISSITKEQPVKIVSKIDN